MTSPEQEPRFDPLPRTMDRKAFAERFGGIYEHFAYAAQGAWARGLGPDTDTPSGLAAAMAAVVAAVHPNDKLRLIRNHPELAAKTAVGGLTAASRSEQAGAGLDQCSPEEFARFEALNRAYKDKFKFPFIIAVGGRNRAEILKAFEERLGNDRDTEFATALEQIDRIALLRLRKLVASD